MEPEAAGWDKLAILLVSHQLAILRESARRVLWVAEGRVVEGSASELLAPERLDRLYTASGGARAAADGEGG